VNGAYAVFILWHYRNDPAASTLCSSTPPTVTAGSASSLRLVNDYSSFAGLLVANAITVVLGTYPHICATLHASGWSQVIAQQRAGVGWWQIRRGSWSQETSVLHGNDYFELDIINENHSAKEVGFPIVKKRIDALSKLVHGIPTNTPFIFDLYTHGTDGQQLQVETLDLVLDCKELVAPHGVRICGVQLNQPSGLMVEKAMEKLWQKRKVLCIPVEVCWPHEKRTARVHAVMVQDLVADANTWGNRMRAAVGTVDNIIVACASEDREAALVAVRACNARYIIGGGLQYASAKVLEDKEVMLAAVSAHGDALQYASKELQADKEVVLAAANRGCGSGHRMQIEMQLKPRDGTILPYASQELQSDEEVRKATEEWDAKSQKSAGDRAVEASHASERDQQLNSSIQADMTRLELDHMASAAKLRAQITGLELQIALALAATDGDTEVMIELISSGARVDSASEDGVTALIAASDHGHNICVQMLLEAGASANQVAHDGVTALLKAAQNGHADCVETLLAARASVDQACNTGATALFIASLMGHEACAGMLIAAGASVDKAANDGVTPLVIASHKGHEPCVQMLLEAGARG
jgi:hypothetical protein